MISKKKWKRLKLNQNAKIDERKASQAYDLIEYYENFYNTKSNPQSKCNSKESLRKFSQK